MPAIHAQLAGVVSGMPQPDPWPVSSDSAPADEAKAGGIGLDGSALGLWPVPAIRCLGEMSDHADDAARRTRAEFQAIQLRQMKPRRRRDRA